MGCNTVEPVKVTKFLNPFTLAESSAFCYSNVIPIFPMYFSIAFLFKSYTAAVRPCHYTALTLLCFCENKLKFQRPNKMSITYNLMPLEAIYQFLKLCVCICSSSEFYRSFTLALLYIYAMDIQNLILLSYWFALLLDLVSSSVFFAAGFKTIIFFI